MFNNVNSIESNDIKWMNFILRKCVFFLKKKKSFHFFYFTATQTTYKIIVVFCLVFLITLDRISKFPYTRKRKWKFTLSVVVVVYSELIEIISFSVLIKNTENERQWVTEQKKKTVDFSFFLSFICFASPSASTCLHLIIEKVFFENIIMNGNVKKIF